MPSTLQGILLREQRSFLRRDRSAWTEHLSRIRAFLGQALEEAPPGRPILILGAGSGLEIPWDRAPRTAVGWDADPLSRWRTLVRHVRWAPWVGGDFTGAFGPLRAAAQRAVRETWSGRRRRMEAARLRLAALLPGLPVDPAPLTAWIRSHRPGVILAANCMGQFAPLVQRVVEDAFAPEDPWELDPDRPDALAVDLDQWTGRLIMAFLDTLAASGAELHLVHDRAVFSTDRGWELGAFVPSWKTQLQSTGALELWDPLVGVDVVAHLKDRSLVRGARWSWPVGEGQLHLVEALVFRGMDPA